jgi:hypothetical protein
VRWWRQGGGRIDTRSKAHTPSGVDPAELVVQCAFRWRPRWFPTTNGREFYLFWGGDFVGREQLEQTIQHNSDTRRVLLASPNSAKLPPALFLLPFSGFNSTHHPPPPLSPFGSSSERRASIDRSYQPLPLRPSLLFDPVRSVLSL